MSNNDTEKTLVEIKNEVENLKSLMKRMSQTLDKLVQFQQLLDEYKDKPF